MADTISTPSQGSGSRHQERRRGGLSLGAVWCIVFCVALIVYLFTCQRSVAWQDSATFQWRILNASYTSQEGLATSHPLLILLGRLAMLLPFGDVLWKLNALSAVGMSLALANFTLLVTSLTKERWIAILVGAMLGVSHISWWLATITETYMWVAAGLAAELWLLVKLVQNPRWTTLALLAFVNGIGLSLHDFALLPVPVYFIVVMYLVFTRRLPVWSAGIGLLAYVLGASLYLGLVVKMAVATGDPMLAIRSALFADGYQAVTNVSLSSAYSRNNAALASLSFMNVLLPFAIVGWVRMKRTLGSVLAWALWSITAIHIVFWVRYASADQFTFLLPSLMMVAIAAAVGAGYAASISARWRNWVFTLCAMSIVVMPVIYGILPGVLRSAGVEVHRTRALPFRDEMRYWITPWKHNENSAQYFCEAALSEALPDGVIIGEATAIYPLLVTRALQPQFAGVSLQVEGNPLPNYNDDPRLFREKLNGRSLYVVSPQKGYLETEFEGIIRDADCVRPEGRSLYRVIWKTKQGT